MDRQIRVLLVDDNEDALEIMDFYLKQLPDFAVVDKCRNGEELVDSLMRTNPDMVLADINMPKLNGVKAIESCLKIRPGLLFIFITSYDEYAVKAFELSALDYIVKPVEKTRLYAALDKARKRMRNDDLPKVGDKLCIREGHDFYYISKDSIIFIEKLGKKSQIHTLERAYSTAQALSELMDHLPEPPFFQSHRSYIINVSKVVRISASNQTYLAFFADTSKHAHVSRLKMDKLQHMIVNNSR